MTLLIDNYDSFSYNLYQLVGSIDAAVRVVRNDEMAVEEIRRFRPDRIILSPGPGRPENAGNIIEVVKMLGQEIPILGVCLGHQAICAAFGATITYAKELMHGKQSAVTLNTDANIRSDAYETASVVGVVSAGTTVTQIGSSDGWVQIDYNGTQGYVKASFVG